MKRISITVLMIIFCFTALMAQPPGHKDGSYRGPEKHMEGKKDHQENMDKILNHLDENVNLTDAQRTEITKILEETTQQIQALEDKNGPQRFEIKNRIQEIKESELTSEEKRAKIREILDENRPQMEAFKEKLVEIRRESKARINDELTVEQKAKLYEIMSEKKEHKARKFDIKSKKNKEGAN